MSEAGSWKWKNPPRENQTLVCEHRVPAAPQGSRAKRRTLQVLLRKLMHAAWKNQLMLSEWQRAVFIPKELNSKDITQFRGIALLNIEGTVLFAVVSK